MKKRKIFVLAFIATFILGGFYSTNAYVTSRSLAGLKADFLGEPHYTPDVIGRNGSKQSGVTKIDYGFQQWNVNVKDGRKILMAITSEKGAILSGNAWKEIDGNTNGFEDIPNKDGLISTPTATNGIKFAAAAKLALPWTQAEISSGTWIIDP